MSDPRSPTDKSTGARKASRCAMAIVVMTILCAVCLKGCKPATDKQNVLDYPSAIEELAIRRERPDPLVASQTRGRQVYEHYCQICHGSEAQGNGFNAAMLDPPPRNFADEAFWRETDDDHLLAVISQGGKAAGKSRLMPSWGRTLDAGQIADVMAFLRTVPNLAKQLGEVEDAESSE